ncbi:MULTISPECIES: hypothetical protein [Actinopolyspora]|uniref:hypothetical protein n=1 Tax=Actinopolyspora TaxID=1849 RepID=UPI000365129C|nr:MULTISPECIES: hypothetical protein [Actinopolyspora]NHD19540.1 hypothetical protein [Actinopolyspora sp. BKK2]NHE78712.1 hypothetical protein [Actinopolyspora sp. BKK1]
MAADARLVDRLMDPTSLERWALESVSDIEPEASKSTVRRAAFRIGTDRITEIAMDEGHRQLAEQTTAEEAASDRAITMSRRRPTRAEDAE